MPAYLIAAIDIHDAGIYERYVTDALRALEPYKTRSIYSEDLAVLYEGEAPANHLVFVEFESLEKIDEFLKSPEYQKAKEFRLASSKTHFFMAIQPPE